MSVGPRHGHPSLRRLQACATATAAKQSHAHLLAAGLLLHTYPLSRLLLTAAPLLGPSYAAAAFLHHSPSLPSATTFLYNTLIFSLSSNSSPRLALSFYSALLYREPHLWPNAHSYPTLLKSIPPSPSASDGKLLHAHIVKFLSGDSDSFVASALLNFYSRCGKINYCRHLFDGIPDPDLPVWNSIISAYARASASAASDSCCPISSAQLGTEGLSLFREMQLFAGARPDEITLVAVIGTCGEMGALAQGFWAHAYLERSAHLEVNLYVCTALIEMYGKCGHLELALQLFNEMREKDTACYNAVLGLLASHGRGHLAMELFDSMKTEGVEVSDVTIVALLSAYAHAGLVDEGCRLFLDMETAFGIERKSEHYGCLVDLLGRAGRVEEAEALVKTMPIRPDTSIYRSLLGASRIHGKKLVESDVTRCLMELEPGCAGNYVLLSNLYAVSDRWEDVKRVRREMRDHDISKVPGVSFVEIDGAVHEFLTGGRSHDRSEEIYSMLDDVVGQTFYEPLHQQTHEKEEGFLGVG